MNDKKERNRINQRNFYLRNTQKISDRKKQYYLDNKEAIDKRNKEYNEKIKKQKQLEFDTFFKKYSHKTIHEVLRKNPKSYLCEKLFKKWDKKDFDEFEKLT